MGDDPATPDREPTPELIAAGEALVRALDARGLAPGVAFWLWFRDVRDWRLVLAGGTLAEAGAREALVTIREILREQEDTRALTPLDVGVKDEDHRAVRAVRTAISTGPGIHGVRIRDNTVAGIRLQRAFVYRST